MVWLQQVWEHVIVPGMTSSVQYRWVICKKVNGMCTIIIYVAFDGNTDSIDRYANMDYLFFSGLRDSKIKTLVVSYDIACQWHKNLWTRMMELPHTYQFIAGQRVIVFVVPKFHLPAHILACQVAFSFNYTKNVGRTEGEAPERGWGNINGAAGMTQEMGPGARRDTLDDFLGDWNWKKVANMGTSPT